MHHCYVCGAPTEDPPWGKDGFCPTYEICACCGCEFGYEDSTQIGIERYRKNWLQSGGVWKEPKYKPAGLGLEEQIRMIPTELPSGVKRTA